VHAIEWGMREEDKKAKPGPGSVRPTADIKTPANVLLVATDQCLLKEGARSIKVLMDGALGVADFVTAADRPEALAPETPEDSPLVRGAGELCRVTRTPLGYWRTTAWTPPGLLVACLSDWRRTLRDWNMWATSPDNGPIGTHPYGFWRKAIAKGSSLAVCIPSRADYV